MVKFKEYYDRDRKCSPKLKCQARIVKVVKIRSPPTLAVIPADHARAYRSPEGAGGNKTWCRKNEGKSEG